MDEKLKRKIDVAVAAKRGDNEFALILNVVNGQWLYEAHIGNRNPAVPLAEIGGELHFMADDPHAAVDGLINVIATENAKQ